MAGLGGPAGAPAGVPGDGQGAQMLLSAYTEMLQGRGKMPAIRGSGRAQ
jgi:hypothetical protein